MTAKEITAELNITLSVDRTRHDLQLTFVDKNESQRHIFLTWLALA